MHYVSKCPAHMFFNPAHSCSALRVNNHYVSIQSITDINSNILITIMNHLTTDYTMYANTCFTSATRDETQLKLHQKLNCKHPCSYKGNYKNSIVVIEAAVGQYTFI